MALVEIDTHYLDIIIIDDITGAILGRPFYHVRLIFTLESSLGFTSIYTHQVH